MNGKDLIKVIGGKTPDERTWIEDMIYVSDYGGAELAAEEFAALEAVAEAARDTVHSRNVRAMLGRLGNKLDLLDALRKAQE